MNLKKLIMVIGLLLIMVTAAACAQAEPEVPQTGPGNELPDIVTPVFDEALREQVLTFLSSQFNVAADQIDLGNIQYMEWQNACLGLGGADEVCAEVITPGYQVTATVGGQEYVVRTDLQGATLRLEGEAGAGE